MPRRDPFQFRRERLLESIDTLMRFREMGYEEFVSGDWRNIPAARAELLTVGDNMHPASGHASREMGRELYSCARCWLTSTSMSAQRGCGEPSRSCLNSGRKSWHALRHRRNRTPTHRRVPTPIRGAKGGENPSLSAVADTAKVAAVPAKGARQAPWHLGGRPTWPTCHYLRGFPRATR